MSSDREVRLDLDPGSTLLLAGPAAFKLAAGEAQCFGGSVQRSQWIKVDESRQAPIFALSSTIVQLKLGPASSHTVLQRSTIPTAWAEAAQIVQRQKGVAVIVGGIDSGKSSLSAFVANRCVDSGLEVAIIDGDVGQADIGPPATISSAKTSKPILGLHDLKADRSFFIGDTSPSTVPHKLIQLLVRLRQEARSSDVVLVNTDGWIGDAGAFRHKLDLLNELQPALVLGLYRGSEIDSLMVNLTTPSVRVPSSPYAKIRSREERKKTREASYRRFLHSSRTLKVDPDRTRMRIFDRPEQLVFHGVSKFRGYLVGLLNESQELLSIGRVRDASDREILVETNASEKPSFLEIGNLVLSPKYEEVDYGVLQ